MTDRQAFGVVVRGMGLLAAFYGLSLLLIVVARLIDTSKDPGNIPHHFPISEEVLFGLVWVVLGISLIRHGQWLVQFAYHSESK